VEEIRAAETVDADFEPMLIGAGTREIKTGEIFRATPKREQGSYGQENFDHPGSHLCLRQEI
jgi:hypothetical protein